MARFLWKKCKTFPRLSGFFRHFHRSKTPFFHTMHIRKVHLSNFKNFADAEITLDAMNVLVGANASGKSNFIKALKFLKDVQELGIENAISLCGGVEYLGNVQVKGNFITTITVEFQSDDRPRILDAFDNDRIIFLENTRIFYTLQITTTKTKKYHVHKEEITYFSVLKYMAQNYSSEIIDVPNYPEFVTTLIRQNNKVQIQPHHLGNSVTIQFPDGSNNVINGKEILPFRMPVQYFMDTEKLSKTKTLIEQFLSLLPYDAFDFSLYDFDLKKAKETTPITGKADLEENGENLAIVVRNILSDKEKKRRFGNLLSDILPFVKKLETEKFYDTSLLLTINEIYNSNARLPSFLLSDGTISITAILTALFFQEKGLAIFEEPEHGIHPALVAKLVQYFYDASKNKQIIITTHSPEVVKYTHLDDLILVSRGDNGFATMSRPKEKEMVQAFLQNELGLDQLFAQNLLDM